MGSMNPSNPYVEIDRLVCGAGFVASETASRAGALQAAVRRKLSDRSICASIVSSLLPYRQAEGRIALLTGFVVPETFPRGETDGPLGTIVLARALHRVGFSPTIYADTQVLDHMTWLAAEIGADVTVRSIPDATPFGFVAETDAVVAIEKPGENVHGYLHDWGGRRIDTGSTSVDSWFVEMNRAGKLTIAIGDRGNEIGFGAVRDELLALVPQARRCSCGCGGGVAAVTPATLLYPAAVSNWGAYGLCAALALSAGDPSLPIRPEEEARLLNVAAVRGCRDGLRMTAAFGVDGIDGSVSIQFVERLRHLVAVTLDAGETTKSPVRGSIEGRNKALHE